MRDSNADDPRAADAGPSDARCVREASRTYRHRRFARHAGRAPSLGHDRACPASCGTGSARPRTPTDRLTRAPQTRPPADVGRARRSHSDTARYSHVFPRSGGSGPRRNHPSHGSLQTSSHWACASEAAAPKRTDTDPTCRSSAALRSNARDVPSRKSARRASARPALLQRLLVKMAQAGPPRRSRPDATQDTCPS